ncbi:MAG TPA: glutathione peroxidase [Verrucomicrobiae bacterium]|nr:glutathione peroxidase [Verrucomicrobiae bacterium]
MLYDIPVRRNDGSDATLREYEGQALLVVNVASQCGLTPQYAGLQKLQEELAGRGLRVLGFPCNQFGAQEPGSSAEIKTFCETNYGVTFALFEKIEVNGAGRHPLYRELIGEGGDIGWNFEKFLVDRTGHVAGRFAPTVAPDDPKLRVEIERLLGA